MNTFASRLTASIARLAIAPLVTLPLVFIGTTDAWAQSQEAVPAMSPVGGVSTASNVRSYANEWLVNPLSELEIGASLRFLTSPESTLGGDDDGELRFTDVGLFRLSLGYSFGRRFELTGGVDLLAKRPSYLDEPVFYGGDLGLRFSLAESWAAFARGAGGPLLYNVGAFGSVAAGVQVRKRLHDTVQVQAAVGGAGTKLFMGEDSGRPWLAEVYAHGEFTMRSPRGEVAGWIGSDFRVPVIDDPGTTMLDPQVSLSFHLGLVLGYVGNWSLYTTLSYVDRGDFEDPNTTLPILDGGFDQTQLTLGASRRFDLEGDKKDEILLEIAR